MAPQKKQSELQRHRAIIISTLDYLEERLGGGFVYDQYDPVKEYYKQQKIQTEKYFKQHRLDRLQQQLSRLTKGLQNRADLNFANYIKGKTGYDIDIFEDLRERVDTIVAQNKISNENELNDVGTMLHYYNETSTKGAKFENLMTLLTNYSGQSNETSLDRKSEYSEVISRVVKDSKEEVTVRISTGPKPKHFKEQVAMSPDGKRSLRVVQWSDGKNASTYVTVNFPTASGAVYGTSGIRSEIKAFWRDNSTIVIETRKEYPANEQHRLVRSYNDIVNIEYIEH